MCVTLQTEFATLRQKCETGVRQQKRTFSSSLIVLKEIKTLPHGQILSIAEWTESLRRL